MKKAIAYCRVSTAAQAGDDKFGIPSQKNTIEQYCNDNEIEIVDWVIDEGVSGAERSRPGFDEILSWDTAASRVDYVIVSKADRISRDINLYYAYRDMLNRLGMEILSVSEDWSAQDKLTAMILENFLAMAAAVERESIRIRTSGGRKQKAKQGGYSGGRDPMGYMVKDKKLVINPKEAEVVRFIFEHKFAGDTMLGTMNALNAAGYKTRNGKEFLISTVQSIWNNERTYRGEYRYGKDGEWVQGQHEPILK